MVRPRSVTGRSLSIGALARRAGLSRATLLYYDRIGLLSPEDRSAKGYRLYGPESQRRLERIRELRSTGLPLTEIASLLDGRSAKEILERQLTEITQAEASLATQKAVVSALLGSPLTPTGLNRESWTALFAEIGLSHAQMSDWHRNFEARAPEAHAAFLRSLGIQELEIATIRQCSR
ncbi:MerR family transcriptional regulator [Lacibacterium aquatile]|uniref:MerR family transcriptional regulator n=1 Tax=Lacibacterium aquatile TaxID=1168082 RepID=A0ABW5DTX5_9PROT